MRRYRLEFGLGQRGSVMQRINSGYQRLFGRQPARGLSVSEYGGANLILPQTRGHSEGRDMHAPFVLAAGLCAGAVDDNFAFRQGQAPGSSRLPAQNFSHARALEAITRKSTNGGAPRIIRSKCA
jgi:hypothetical protein